MTFKRINGDTICCILSQEDMQDYGVELEDFLMNKEKIQDLLHEIVELAGEELGFNMKKGMLSLQIMPLPDNSISIMFSERGQMDVMDIVGQMTKALGDLHEVAKAAETAKTEKPHKSGKATKHTKSAKEQAAGISDLRIYEFTSLDKVLCILCFYTDEMQDSQPVI